MFRVCQKCLYCKKRTSQSSYKNWQDVPYRLHGLYTWIQALPKSLSVSWKRIRIITGVPFRGWPKRPCVNRQLSPEISNIKTTSICVKWRPYEKLRYCSRGMWINGTNLSLSLRDPALKPLLRRMSRSLSRSRSPRFLSLCIKPLIANILTQ